MPEQWCVSYLRRSAIVRTIVQSNAQTGIAKILNVVAATFVSILLGFIILKWELLTNALGLDIHLERGTSIVTIEYVIGFGVTFFLGYVFHERPVLCGICFMFGPTLVTHAIYISERGVPNMWPVEVLLLMILTIPYIGLAYAGAFVHRKTRAKGAGSVS